MARAWSAIWGERDHSKPQTFISAYLFYRQVEWGISVYVEQRVQVSPTCFRVPDICVPGSKISVPLA